VPAPSSTSWRGWRFVVPAAAAILAAVLAVTLRPRPVEAPHRVLTLRLDESATTVTSTAISHDGRRLAYVRGGELWVRDLDQPTSRRLATGLGENFRPAWSPASDAVVIQVGTRLDRVDVASGVVTPLADAGDFVGGSGGSWTSDGHILFTRGHDHVYRIPESGGVPEVFVARVDTADGDLHNPCALPGGRGVIYVRHLLRGGPVVLAVATGGKRHDLLRLPTGFVWDPVYDPRGYIVFSRLGEAAGVWAVRFSLDRLEVSGDPMLIAPGASSASVSDGGLLVYRLGTTSINSRVVVMNRAGAVVDSITGAVDGLWTMSLSPDQQHLAIEVRKGGDFDIWLEDLARRTETRFAIGPLRQMSPAWSADGRELFYHDDALGGIVARPADGSQAARPLRPGFWPRPTPDGQHLFYMKEGKSSEIWYASVGGRDSVMFPGGAANVSFPSPAPQGGCVLYQSDETGAPEIFLRQYPAGTGRWQVSTAGGNNPLWSPSGDRAYYVHDGKFLEVDATLSPAVKFSNPRELFDLSRLGIQAFGRLTVVPTSNPDRFIVAKLVTDDAPSHVDAVMVENWPGAFAKRK
jgi:serine/threonine-protein kinase